METEIYNITADCSNCGFRGNVVIPKKQMIENTECPRCGNKTLERYQEPYIQSPPNPDPFY